jgi:hypothetical protein
MWIVKRWWVEEGLDVFEPLFIAIGKIDPVVPAAVEERRHPAGRAAGVFTVIPPPLRPP